MNNKKESKMNIEKLTKKVARLESTYDRLSDHSEKSEILSDIHDLQLRIKKDQCNINFRLTGDNKYYIANQMNKFRLHILKHGVLNYTADQVQEMGLSFNRYSINLSYNQYGTDLKRFNSLDKMIGFVIGFNFVNEGF